MNDLGLAVEATKLLTKADGAKVIRKKAAGIKITDVLLGEVAAKKIGKPAGRYITLEGDPALPQMSLFTEKALKELVCGKKFLAIGLGNPDITHDSLGAFAARKIIPQSKTLGVIETDVEARTGISSARLVRGAVCEIRPDCVIAIDALACSDPLRIGKTVQLSDTGFILGSGTGKNCGEISERYLKIPVVAVGVPTMTAYDRIVKSRRKSFLVTCADIDIVISRWAEVIASAVNCLGLN